MRPARPPASLGYAAPAAVRAHRDARRDSRCCGSDARLLLGAGLAVALLSGLAFSPALSGTLLNWDDPLVLSENPWVRGLDRERLAAMWTRHRAGHYHPLTWMSLAWDYRLFGLDPPSSPRATGYRATNLGLHAGFGVACFALALELLRRAHPGRPPRAPLIAAATAAALLHALHPLRCESVCWVTERRDVLSGLFFVLAVLAALRSAPPAAAQPRLGWAGLAALSSAVAGVALAAALSLEEQRIALSGPSAPAWLLLAGLCWALSCRAALGSFPDPRGRARALWTVALYATLLASLLAKAWGIVLPALLLLLDVWPLRRVGLWPRPDLRRAAALVGEKAPLLLLALLFTRLAAWAQAAQRGSMAVWREHDWLERGIQALYGLSFYPWKTLWPVPLAPLYPLPQEISLLEPRFLVGALVSLGITGALLALARRFPAGLACWAAYALIAAPVLGWNQSGPQLVADRYSYLATLPLALLAGGGLLAALERGGARARIALAIAAAAALTLLPLSWRQSHVWRSSESLWTHADRHGPPAAITQLNLGLVRMQQAARAGDPQQRRALEDEAFERFRRGASLRPSYPQFPINEALLLAQRASRAPPVQREALLDRADALAHRAAAMAEQRGAGLARVLWLHGRLLFEAQRLDAAAERLDRAVARDPDLAPARRVRAAALLARAQRDGRRQPEVALAEVRRALDDARHALLLEPDAPGSQLLLATAHDLEWRLLEHLGRADEASLARGLALQAYRAVPPSEPGHAVAQRRIAELSGRAPANAGPER